MKETRMKPLCVVTGTSSGIGTTLARTLLERGWEVVGLARRAAPLQAEGYRHVVLDLADVAGVQAYFEGPFLAEAGLAGRPRVGLVNNAGVLGPVGSQEELSATALAQAFHINVVAPVWLTGFFSRQCRDTRLCVVNISSGAAFRPNSGWMAYCSTKAALRMAGAVFGEDVERLPELQGRAGRVAVVNYSPGMVDTPMQDQVREASPEVFPNVQRHIDFYRDGKVKPAELPVAEIIALLERDDLPPYSEMTYGG